MDELMYRKKSRAAQNQVLKINYGRRLRLSLIWALFIVIILFLISPELLPVHETVPTPPLHVDVVEIPSTDIQLRSPAPPRPTVPVPAQAEELPESLTLTPVQFREYTAIEYPRPPEPAITSNLDRYLRKPEPEGGYEALRDNIEYPQLARQAGIEGTVVLRIHVAADGEVTETVIIEGIPRTGFNEAAIAGIEKTRFKPARRFDQPIAYWDSITVNFRIKNR